MTSAPIVCLKSAVLRGAQCYPITVEVSLSTGIPGITIVGMGDTSVQESRSRIRSALKAAGYSFPRSHVVVNLSPSDIKKSGSGLDLPIALGILMVSGQLQVPFKSDTIVVGELSLDGRVHSMRGMVAFELLAKQNNCALISGAAPGEFLSIPGVRRYVARWLTDFSSELREGLSSKSGERKQVYNHLYEEICAQDLPKRALVIAATGGHALLMQGSPGSGKSMLAARIPGILPRLSEEEQLETALIHSVCAEPLDAIESGIRPFRSPHHSISCAGLVGGGRPVKPGELSLAHAGVLFLDELPEFSPSTLQSLRQPLEQGCVRVVRVDGLYEFPASVQLLAACNPCPCGYLGDRERSCTCAEQAVQRYQQRVGGPLLDRIDMVVEVARPHISQWMADKQERSTAEMKAEVESARAFAAERSLSGQEAGTERELSLIHI